MNRRTFSLLAVSLLGGFPRHFVAGAATPSGETHGKLMWDPAYLALPPQAKAPWDRWLAQGDLLRRHEIAVLDAEIRQTRRKKAVPAKVGRTFEVPEKPAAWFAGAEARKTADYLLTWQTPSGGWTKNTAMTRRRRAPGQRWSPWGDWDYVATIDNQATTSQLGFLALVASATGMAPYQDAVERGLGYLLAAQMPTGGWPQVFPLQGKYHDHITFNDDAMVNVLTLLRNVKNKRAPWLFVRAPLRDACDAALQRGIDCILRCQIVVQGQRTAWCAQHHAITLAPAGARAYELASISGGESVGILRFLMSLGRPSAGVRTAVEAAVAWLRRSSVDAAALGLKGGGGSTRWARFYEIETNRPLFSDSDGAKRYSFREVRTKRKSYAWFTESPATVLSRDYPKWRRRVDAGK